MWTTRDSHPSHVSYISSCAAKMMKKSIGVIASEYNILVSEHTVFRISLTFPYDAQTEWPRMGPSFVPLNPEG